MSKLTYNSLASEIKTIITEHVFMSRWTLIEGYWSVGKLIRENNEDDVTDLLQRLAVDLDLSERTLWYAVKCFDKFPDINQIPEGKNISWTKIINKYLTDGSKKNQDNPRRSIEDVFQNEFGGDIQKMGQEMVKSICKKYNFPGSVSSKYNLYREIYRVLERILK